MNTSLVWLQRILAAVAAYVLADPVTFASYLPPTVSSRYMAAVALLSAFLPGLLTKLKNLATETDPPPAGGGGGGVGAGHTTITK